MKLSLCAFTLTLSIYILELGWAQALKQGQVEYRLGQHFFSQAQLILEIKWLKLAQVVLASS